MVTAGVLRRLDGELEGHQYEPCVRDERKESFAQAEDTPQPREQRGHDGAQAVKGIGTSDPGVIGYTVPENRRLLAGLVQRYAPDPERIWSWSRWRRRRQYQARLCHYRRRGYALI